MSPTQRSLAYLKGLGYWPEVVEHWVPLIGKKQKPGETLLPGVRRDLLHCIDILAFGAGHILAVQTTDITSISTRVRKIQGLPEFDVIKRAGLRIEVHGWDESMRGGSVRVIDMTTMETVLDSRVMTGRSSKARKLHQLGLV